MDQQKIKWSVVLITQGKDLGQFIRCFTKLIKSVDIKRTEIRIACPETSRERIASVTPHLIPDSYPVVIAYPSSGEDFASLCRFGAELATGEYLIFVDDSVVVSNNFLVKLTFGLVNYGKKYSIDEACFAVPASNNTLPQANITPETIDVVQEQIDKQSEQSKPWAYTSTFSRFCFMIKSEVWRELGGLDSQFQDNETLMLTDFSNRLLSAGHVSALATDVIVYTDAVHNDSADRFLEYHEKGKTLLGTASLAVLYRIKISDEIERDVFVKSLKRSTEFADRLFILDDNSKVKLGVFLREEHPELWEKITKYEKFTRPYDEKRDWNQLLTWVNDAKCNWVFCLEGDEIPEDKVDRNLIQKLIHPVNPKVMGYFAHHYYFWNDLEHWRFDKVWGQESQVRLARLLPNRTITSPGSLARACGYVPTIPSENLYTCSIRIENYGYINHVQRLAKKAFYEKIDNKNYNLLVNEHRLDRYLYPVTSTISVYSPVKNGGVFFNEWLDHVVSFADEIVIGNDGMTPDDVKKAELFGAKVVLTNMGDNWARGRNLIVKQCSSAWILQLDLDERINDFSVIRRMMDADIYDAWMVPIDNLQPDGSTLVTDTIRLFRRTPGVEYWGLLHETVDDFARKAKWRTSWSPVRITHYGYVKTSSIKLWDKMQRYIEINLKQIEEFPEDGRAYYNLALHVLEDNLVADGIRLLEIAQFLAPNVPLSALELGKTHLQKANFWLANSLKLFPKQNANVPYIQNMLRTLKSIMPHNYSHARGHCLAYFMRNPSKGEWLRKHLLKMEEKIEVARTGRLEKV